MAIIKVVCGIIFNDDLVYLCRRNPHKSLGGYWEFPGGKIEPGEEEESALSRELFEELGMKVEIKEYFKTVVHNYGSFEIELIAYICKFEEASYRLTDHNRYEWVNRKDLTQWNLAPADIPIAEALVRGE